MYGHNRERLTTAGQFMGWYADGRDLKIIRLGDCVGPELYLVDDRIVAALPAATVIRYADGGPAKTSRAARRRTGPGVGIGAFMPHLGRYIFGPGDTGGLVTLFEPDRPLGVWNPVRETVVDTTADVNELDNCLIALPEALARDLLSAASTLLARQLTPEATGPVPFTKGPKVPPTSLPTPFPFA